MTVPARLFCVPTTTVNQRGSVWWMCGWLLLGSMRLFQGLWSGNTMALQPLQASVLSDSDPNDPLQDAEFKSIESIELGERVAVDEERGDHDQEFGADVDPATWKQIDLRAPKKDGTRAEVSLLRPAKWLEEQLALSHQTMQISVPECGIDGRAEIRRIRPCPVIRPGPDRVVTDTFKHQSARVVDVYVEGSEEPIGATGNHPFWSEDRKDYVRADELTVGEHLRALTGKTPKVAAVVPQGKFVPVYNLEIQFAHVYLIGEQVILVHNGGNKTKGKKTCPEPQPGEPLYVGSHGSSYRANREAGITQDFTPHHSVQAAATPMSYSTSPTINIPRTIHPELSTTNRPKIAGSTLRQRLNKDINELRPLLKKWLIDEKAYSADDAKQLVNQQLNKLRSDNIAGWTELGLTGNEVY
ncbi:MAG: hypothetical protein JWM11_4873 [Planctomycetaceae bacterium]|nr:hypothetical protein [Planctomycetaceae bacterium]